MHDLLFFDFYLLSCLEGAFALERKASPKGSLQLACRGCRTSCLVFLSLVFLIPFDVGGGADLGEGGRNFGHGVVEGGAGMADGDANEVHAAPISS